MFLFTIRDLLWLMVVVACLSGWAAHYGHWHKRDAEFGDAAFKQWIAEGKQHNALREKLYDLLEDENGPLYRDQQLEEALFGPHQPPSRF